MKESDFVKQNNQKWQEFEDTVFGYEGSDPKVKSKLFVQITDDLSFARTFYPNRSVRQYLNGVAQLLFNEVQLSERFSFKKIASFFTETFPAAMYANRRRMLISLIVFVICFAIGVFSSIKNPEYSRQILGEHYVNLTEENIESGNPMAIYGSESEIQMFFAIAFNNLRVTYMTFVFGIFTSLGTLLILMHNSIMVGVFQYFFIDKGLFWDSFLTIWTHGTIEISCIIVAGGAGLQLGLGLLFPGTYSRIDAFKMSARSALVIISGITPLVIIAAFIESFQTRHTDIPDLLRFGFIILCLFFVLFYFFWYPRKKFSGVKNAYKAFEFEPINVDRFDFKTGEIYPPFRIFSYTMAQLIRYAGRSFGTIAILSVLFAGSIILLQQYDAEIEYILGTSSSDWNLFFDFDTTPFLAIPTLFFGALALTTSSRQNIRLHEKTQLGPGKWLVFFAFSILLCGMLSFLFSQTTFWRFSFTLLVPFVFLIQVIALHEKGNPLNGLRLLLPYLRSNWGKLFAISIFLFTLLTAYNYLIGSLLLQFINESVVIVLTDNYERERLITNFLSISFNASLVFGGVYVINTAMHLLFYSLKETNTAQELFSRIKKQLITAK